MKLAECAVMRSEVEAVLPFIDEFTANHIDKFTGVIVRLPDVIKLGGMKLHRNPIFSGTDVLPNLAIGRVARGARTTLRISDGELEYDVHTMYPTKMKSPFPKDTNGFLYQTLVPPIPEKALSVMNKAQAKRLGPPLQNYKVLYEVSKWEQISSPPRPAMEDPAILERLVGDLWGVIYTWDLTPTEKRALERAGVGL